MCATYQFKKQVIKPGKEITAVSESGLVQHVWAGFARAEILDWWQRKGGILLDIYADRFAERSDQTRQLIWDDIPNGVVIRGLLDRQSGEPLIKVVTRASTLEELQKFQHPRMPVLEQPLFPVIDIPENSGEPQLF